MTFTRKLVLLATFLLALLVPSSDGFAPACSTTSSTCCRLSQIRSSTPVTVVLNERRWNFNEGQSPWGLKKNAEIWNGRMAQMGFLFVLLQELIQGKGIVEGLREGDPVNMACLGVFFVSVGGLTAWLAIKGDDSYVDEELGRK